MEKLTAEENRDFADQILEVVKQQKRLIWLIALELLLMVFVGLSGAAWEAEGRLGHSRPALGLALALGVTFVTILGIICVYVAYRIGRALEISMFWLVILIVLLLVPDIRIVPLLYINGKATKFLRANGVHVGLLGAKRETIRQIPGCG